MKAIHEWNLSRGGRSFAADLARGARQSTTSARQQVRIGNLISPLTLYGDATQPLEDLAKDLKQQMSKAMRQENISLCHRLLRRQIPAVQVFRKIAANPELTGSATSHFAWFEQSQSIHEDVVSNLAGALQITNQQIYTPVCLHMGAAMAILTWPDRTQVFLTHRLNAFSTADAEMLLDLMVRELDQKRVSASTGCSMSSAASGDPVIIIGAGPAGLAAATRWQNEKSITCYLKKDRRSQKHSARSIRK